MNDATHGIYITHGGDMSAACDIIDMTHINNMAHSTHGKDGDDMANSKDLKGDTSESMNIMGQIARGTPDRHATDGKYRFSLVMPDYFQEYLKKASYDASEPGHIVSINQYICDLIQNDIDKGGIIDYHKGAKHGGK